MKVRRNDWPEGIYGFLHEGMLCLKKEDGIHTWLVSSGDLEGEDWETCL